MLIVRSVVMLSLVCVLVGPTSADDANRIIAAEPDHATVSNFGTVTPLIIFSSEPEPELVAGRTPHSRRAWALSGRAWGPEQATGAPNTPQAGDIQSAWASLETDRPVEWLELEYNREVAPIAILVYETHHPGALERITLFRPDGKEIEVWTGNPQALPTDKIHIRVVPLQVDFPARRFRLYLDSSAVPGWNEIDAVGLLDAAGKTEWAAAATASSTYAEKSGRNGMIVSTSATTNSIVTEQTRRLARLEAKLEQLQSTVDDLKAIVLEQARNKDRE